MNIKIYNSLNKHSSVEEKGIRRGKELVHDTHNRRVYSLESTKEKETEREIEIDREIDR